MQRTGSSESARRLSSRENRSAGVREQSRYSNGKVRLAIGDGSGGAPGTLSSRARSQPANERPSAADLRDGTHGPPGRYGSSTGTAPRVDVGQGGDPPVPAIHGAGPPMRWSRPPRRRDGTSAIQCRTEGAVWPDRGRSAPDGQQVPSNERRRAAGPEVPGDAPRVKSSRTGADTYRSGSAGPSGGSRSSTGTTPALCQDGSRGPPERRQWSSRTNAGLDTHHRKPADDHRWRHGGPVGRLSRTNFSPFVAAARSSVTSLPRHGTRTGPQRRLEASASAGECIARSPGTGNSLTATRSLSRRPCFACTWRTVSDPEGPKGSAPRGS